MKLKLLELYIHHKYLAHISVVTRLLFLLSFDSRVKCVRLNVLSGRFSRLHRSCSSGLFLTCSSAAAVHSRTLTGLNQTAAGASELTGALSRFMFQVQRAQQVKLLTVYPVYVRPLVNI